MLKPLTVAFFCLTLIENLPAQDRTDVSSKYLTWTALQLFPSPVLFQDQDKDNSRVVLGLRWQVTPLNISFRANKYVTPFQFFMINPVRKFSGSIEFFVQPEWSAGNFKYSKLGRWGVSAGSRLTLPIKGDGEIISISAGGKYNYRKDLEADNHETFGIEGGVYFFYGMIGLQANYNFDAKSKYNIGIYFKYF